MIKYLIGSLLILFSTMVNGQWDPTAPWAVPTEKTVNVEKQPEVFALPKLQSLVCDERDCKAVVNNQFVSTGDRITGFDVLSITPSFLMIGKAARQWRLTVLNPPQGIKIG